MDAATLRKTLKLSDDTPDEEVLRVANERLSADPPPTPEPEEGAESETPAEGQETTTEGEPETEGEQPPAQTAQGSVVTIDAGTLAQLQENAALGRQAHEAQQSNEDTRILTEAMEAGKFPPARFDHWKALLAADREGTIATLKTLAENVIPIDQRSRQETTDDGQVAAGYPAEWLPEVAGIRAQAETGQRPRVQVEV